jgi:hypothetical protein
MRTTPHRVVAANRVTPIAAAAAIFLGLCPVAPALADDDRNQSKKQPQIECTIEFSLRGWSAFYKTAKGEGTIACDNGERATVALRVKGGGLTVGRSRILEGKGHFSNVFGIDEVFGSYAAVEAHAGAVKSQNAIAMTKGPVSLALAGTGQGWDLGLSFARFRVIRR